MLGHEAIMALRRPARHSWTERDAMIYAMAIGMGTDPLDDSELDFVYEKRGLKVVPTFPVVVGFHELAMEAIGLNYAHLLHGEHAVTLHRPFPASGVANAEGRMLGAWDKGPGRGAIFSHEKILTLEGTSEPLATIVTTTFARADGGYGGPAEGQPAPHRVPDRTPDHTVDMPTLRRQALLYRLTGDDNPLHADPAAAAEVGFPQPILHGLCTYGICCRAVLATYCANDPRLIRHHAVRFSAPVFPGETITVDLWRDGDIVSFEARVKERDITVIRNGLTLLG